MPESIGHLQELQELNLNSNRLQKLPDSICKLENLVNLNLESNRLKSLPEGLTNLQKLKELNCKGNSLKAYPQVLLQLQNVNFLHDPFPIVSKTLTLQKKARAEARRSSQDSRVIPDAGPSAALIAAQIILESEG